LLLCLQFELKSQVLCWAEAQFYFLALGTDSVSCKPNWNLSSIWNLFMAQRALLFLFIGRQVDFLFLAHVTARFASLSSVWAGIAAQSENLMLTSGELPCHIRFWSSIKVDWWVEEDTRLGQLSQRILGTSSGGTDEPTRRTKWH
jgi:hypothetical protein